MQNQPKLTVIDNLQGVQELIEYLKDKEYVAYDCETTGLSRRDQVIGFSICASEDHAYYIILKAWDPQSCTLLTTIQNTIVAPLFRALLSKKLIMHNAVFDCYMAESNFGVRLIDSLHTDTMIMAHLINENRRVGLKELGESLLGDKDAAAEQKLMKESVIANGGSMTKKCYELYKGDPHLIGKYGAKDALMTYRLFLELVPELYDQGLDKFFYEDESMPLLRGPTYELNTTGLQVDLQGMASLKKQLEAECLEAKAFIYKEIDAHIKDKYLGTTKKNVFNIGSSSQLAWLLFGKMELEFNTLTKAGKTACKSLGLRLPYTFPAKREFIAVCESAKDQINQPSSTINGKVKKATKYRDPWYYIACDKTTLKKLAPNYKWIEVLLEYQRKTKLLKTYIQGITDRTQYGVIQPGFLQHGTSSGRYASRNPNFQNLPRDDKRIKGCITSRPGRTFVGADYSQLEPRVFAYYSNDPLLLSAFGGTTDFYSVIGMEVWNKTDCTPQKDGSPDAFGVKYKKLRDQAKTIALARVYGALANQLAKTTGKSPEATQNDLDNYDAAFPGVPEMAKRFHELAKTKGYAESLFGRKRRIPEAMKIDKIYGKLPHAEYPYEVRGLLNLACNHVIQSTAASIVNRAMIAFYNNAKAAGLKCQFVLQVHDSIIIECDEADAEDVALLLEDAMCNTTDLKTVALEAKPLIGKGLDKV